MKSTKIGYWEFELKMTIGKWICYFFGHSKKRRGCRCNRCL